MAVSTSTAIAIAVVIVLITIALLAWLTSRTNSSTSVPATTILIPAKATGLENTWWVSVLPTGAQDILMIDDKSVVTKLSGGETQVVTDAIEVDHGVMFLLNSKGDENRITVVRDGDVPVALVDRNAVWYTQGSGTPPRQN